MKRFDCASRRLSHRDFPLCKQWIPELILLMRCILTFRPWSTDDCWCPCKLIVYSARSMSLSSKEFACRQGRCVLGKWSRYSLDSINKLIALPPFWAKRLCHTTGKFEAYSKRKLSTLWSNFLLSCNSSPELKWTSFRFLCHVGFLPFHWTIDHQRYIQQPVITHSQFVVFLLHRLSKQSLSNQAGSHH